MARFDTLELIMLLQWIYLGLEHHGEVAKNGKDVFLETLTIHLATIRCSYRSIIFRPCPWWSDSRPFSSPSASHLYSTVSPQYKMPRAVVSRCDISDTFAAIGLIFVWRSEAPYDYYTSLTGKHPASVAFRHHERSTGSPFCSAFYSFPVLFIVLGSCFSGYAPGRRPYPRNRASKKMSRWDSQREKP